MILETREHERAEAQPGLVKMSIDEFRKISKIGERCSIITESDSRKIQIYNLEIPEFDTTQAILQFGYKNGDDLSDYIQIEIVDNQNEIHLMHVSSNLIWERVGCFLHKSLVNWSIEKSDEILDIIYTALSPILEYFEWSVRCISVVEKFPKVSENSLIVLDKTKSQNLVVVDMPLNVLIQLEKQIRRFSSVYHKNCIWLGRKLKFKAKCYLNLTQSNCQIEDLKNINIGDLFSLQQRWINPETVQISSKIVCIGRNSKQWTRKIFLKIDTKDALMEFNDEDWKEDQKNDQSYDFTENHYNENFTIGEKGPDAVHLNILIGTTILSFNDLCNIQAGSLIELKESLLPMVKFNIGEETIFEGELVRLNDQLMVQVIKKVD